MRYIIIEDEQLAAKRLRSLIESCRSDYEFVAKFDSVEAASISLPALSFDLLFMDIQLADGLSFDIFDQINIDKPIIFTTAYDEFALKAFKTNSVDYLLKPIAESELDSAITKFEKNFNKPKQTSSGTEIEQLMKSLQPSGKERFVVKVGEHLKTVETQQVQLIYSQDKGTYLFTDFHLQLKSKNDKVCSYLALQLFDVVYLIKCQAFLMDKSAIFLQFYL